MTGKFPTRLAKPGDTIVGRKAAASRALRGLFYNSCLAPLHYFSFASPPEGWNRGLQREPGPGAASGTRAERRQKRIQRSGGSFRTECRKWNRSRALPVELELSAASGGPVTGGCSEAEVHFVQSAANGSAAARQYEMRDEKARRRLTLAQSAASGDVAGRQCQSAGSEAAKQYGSLDHCPLGGVLLTDAGTEPLAFLRLSCWHCLRAPLTGNRRCFPSLCFGKLPAHPAKPGKRLKFERLRPLVLSGFSHMSRAGSTTTTDYMHCFSIAALMNPTNNGCGRFGRLLNSGWYCTPT